MCVKWEGGGVEGGAIMDLAISDGAENIILTVIYVPHRHPIAARRTVHKISRCESGDEVTCSAFLPIYMLSTHPYMYFFSL